MSFWNNLPIISQKDFFTKGEEVKSLEVNNVPVKLPQEFSWVTLNHDDNELLEFLNYYYYDNFGKKIKVHFTKEYLSWIFSGEKELLIGIKTNEKLIAFVGASTVQLNVNKNNFRTVNVNLFCVHPMYRGKRLTPVLISELTRRSTNLGYKQGIFSTQKQISTTITKLNQFQRAVNVDYLHEIGILRLEKDVKTETVKQTNRLPTKPRNKNFTPLDTQNDNHIEQTVCLLNEYMEKYNLYQTFTKEEFIQTFCNNSIVSCFVLLDDNNEVIDMISYYKTQLRTSSDPIKYIRKGNLYYYTTFTETSYRLLNDMLILSQNDVDIFGAFDNMENEDILRESKFEEFSSPLNIFVFNWKYRGFRASQVGFIPVTV